MEQNQSSVSLKKSSPSAQACYVCLSLQKRELAQPKSLGWLKPSEDVMMCKASFTHTHTSISCTEDTKPQSVSGICISDGRQHGRSSVAHEMEKSAGEANHKGSIISSIVCYSQFVKQLVYSYHHIINLATDDKHNKDY